MAEAYPGLYVIAYMPGFLTPDQEPAEDERCKCLQISERCVKTDTKFEHQRVITGVAWSQSFQDNLFYI